MKILVIDDEAILREDITELLKDHGYDSRSAPSGQAGLKIADEFLPDVILCDLTMPGMDGIEVLDNVRIRLPETEFIVVTAYGSMETAIEAFRKGACDYILKPVNFETLLFKISRLEKQRDLSAEVRELRRQVNSPQHPIQLIGQSKQIQEIISLVEHLKLVDTSVLLLGETGAGKEVVARYIHEQSNRSSKPFIALNCAAIPETLMESELFGYMHGSFTGASKNKTGLFEAADGGTLFLDEFCEMPAALQSKLLRVLERKEIMPIGGTVAKSVNVRLLAATNREPLEFVKEGKLREDLYYRIRVMEINIPPLRERRVDIPLLAQFFVDQFNRDMKRTVKGLSNEALQAMMLFDWPGNVRELKNAVERAMIFTMNGYLKLEHFPREVSNQPEKKDIPDDLKSALKAYENAHILSILSQTGGNRLQASKSLGVDRSTLHRKLASMEEEGMDVSVSSD